MGGSTIEFGIPIPQVFLDGRRVRTHDANVERVNYDDRDDQREQLKYELGGKITLHEYSM